MSDPDAAHATAGRSLRRVELDAARAAAWLAAEGCTDGLPVVLPEPHAVEAAVAASGRPAQQLLGVVPPQFAGCTVEKLAVCAVMAGCPPAAMPVVVACAEALLDPAFRVASVQATTSPAAPLFVVTGAADAAERAGLVSGTGAFGPAAGTNLAIGRAIRLLLLVVGGGRVGDGDPATLGMPAKLGAVLAERVTASPWPSLGERRGVPASRTAVAAFAVTGMWQISEPATAVDDVVHQVLHGMISPGQCSQPRLPQAGEQLLVLSPPVAQILARRFPRVEALQEALFATVRIPMQWVPPYKREATRSRLDELGIAWHGDLVPLAEGPEAFVVVVAGGDAGVQSMGLSTLTLSRSAVVAVDV
jgi:hypothetical protein